MKYSIFSMMVAMTIVALLANAYALASNEFTTGLIFGAWTTYFAAIWASFTYVKHVTSKDEVTVVNGIRTFGKKWTTNSSPGVAYLAAFIIVFVMMFGVSLVMHAEAILQAGEGWLVRNQFILPSEDDHSGFR